MDYYITPRHVRDLKERQLSGDWFQLFKRPGALVNLPTEPVAPLEFRTPRGERFLFQQITESDETWFQWLTVEEASALIEQRLFWSAWDNQEAETASGKNGTYVLRKTAQGCAFPLILMVYGRHTGLEVCPAPVASIVAAKIFAEEWEAIGNENKKEPDEIDIFQ